ncbi:penicillin-binding transpeptidase domain-containing protein [Clostridium estertheticum]|uniref:penicillin-binding transpeptidase domain-containing protein n=1 Tax=Clostridium estertheticum TaxID=238834 RepID=UPI0013E980E2|nr:penicillin-binding transpeptidase domain-containing protein [Clostridium estertheticum]MBZ9687138.1 penicillin-binding transpeptidase domain-containing protein [Clostridium estertheticum]
MLKKNFKIILFTAVIIIITALMVVFLTKGDSATQTFDAYKNNWVKKDFKTMYSMLSVKTKETVTEKQFIDKYSAIYSGIGAESISIKVENEDKIKIGNKKNITIPFSIVMNTAAGKLNMQGYQATMVREKVNNKKQWALFTKKQWTIVWDEKMIFPNMEAGDKVRIKLEMAKRGEISDRNGNPLAINAPIVCIGIQPNRFVKNKDSNISQMAKILDIDATVIETKLKANANSEQFVPIINILPSEKVKIAEVMKLEGVIHNKPEGRIYPGGEAFGSLIGYIEPINAEELEKMAGQGYSSVSLVGKAGLEQVHEKRLKGENGATIYISKEVDGKEIQKLIILKKEAKAGENIKLSVDSELQKKIYAGMNKDAGACAALNPKSGEVLALVSSPSYDSNARTTYISNSQSAAWKSAKEPFKNRFKAVYSPGSTFKMITAAIGLDQGKIKPNELINIQGTQWQKDKSWGPHMVTRVSDKVKSVNLQDAFVYSDNIYFAMAALKIGKEEFIKGSSKFGMGEKLPIDYPIANSQVVTDNIKNEVALADTGYGQGQVLMSPLQLALSYSAVVNDGNIMSPTLESFNTKVKSKVWKANAISVGNIKFIKDGLTAVIENPDGTGNLAKINGIALAGKTGTAELKKDAKDTTAENNGWFVCMDTANPQIVVSMLIEDVKNKGDSHYVVPIVKGVMEYYLNKVPK